MVRLAVYGTLRKSFGNNYLLKNSEFLGERALTLPFKMVDLGSFPGLTPDDKFNTIIVEVFNVSETLLMSRIDALEGHPNFYTRISIDIDNKPTYIYVLTQDRWKHYHKVESGDWNKYTGGMYGNY